MVPTRRRLDAELVRRGLVASRSEAQRLIAVGGVLVSGKPSARPATLVASGDPIEVTESDRWASRAGGKLAAAVEAFAVPVAGRRALDVGASTGGFTDVLLANGAESVTAIDVGDPIVLTLEDPKLWENPWIYIVEPSNLVLKDTEVPILREFLLRGGTLTFDDFHGPFEWELFEKQDDAYKESVLPKNIQARLAVEAGASLGWERYAQSVIGIDHYGASAPYKIIFEKFGFTVENVVARAKDLM